MTEITDDIDFSGISVYRDYASGGSTQMQSLLTSAVMAWSDDTLDSNTVLTLGSTGNIQFIVEGKDRAGEMSLNTETNMFSLEGKHGTHIKGGDTSNTVEISATTFTYDASTHTNLIDAGDHHFNGTVIKKNFEFDAKLSEYTGSVQVHGDMLTNGHMISRSLNVAKVSSDGSNIRTGFGFRVNDKDALELYKYDHDQNLTQRIALFGSGQVCVGDAYSNFPVFGVDTYDEHNQIVTNQGQGIASLWETQDTNIFYNDGTVLIGHSEATVGQSYDLEVHEMALYKTGIEFGESGGLTITPSGIINVPNIQFNDAVLNQQPFNGKLSSLNFDDLPSTISFRNDSLWFTKAQEVVSMNKFNYGNPYPGNLLDREAQFTLGHLFYGKQYEDTSVGFTTAFNTSIDGVSAVGTLEHKGMKTVWFDQFQNEVKLSDFKENSLTHLANLSISNTLSVETICFEKFRSIYKSADDAGKTEFDGTMETLLNTKVFNLSNFNDDIDYKIKLDVDVLSIGTVGNITPNNTTTIVGTSSEPFAEGYFNSTHIGSTTISTEDDCCVINNPLRVSEIILDGSSINLNSFGIDGAERTTFNSINLSSYNSKVYRIKGDVTFKRDRPQDIPATELKKLYIYEVTNSSGTIVPNPVTGKYYQEHSSDNNKFELVNGKIIQEQNVNTVDINLTNESGVQRKKLFLSSYRPASINDIIDLNIYVPETYEFNHKFFVDFNYFHNDHMIENPYGVITPATKYLHFGYISGESSVCNKIKYLPCDKNDATIKMLVQYMSYYDLPIVNDDESTIADTKYFIATAKTRNRRRIGHYYYRSDASTVAQGDDTQGFGVYPKISFRNWKNDRNDTSFEVIPFSDWEVIKDGKVVPNKFGKDTADSLQWQRILLELTFSYIKYGSIGMLIDEDIGKINVAISDGVLTRAESYEINTRLFNGISINSSVKLNKEIFEIDGNHIHITNI